MANARQDATRYQGPAHPLCFTYEVMEHQFTERFKPINSDKYDGTTDPTIWVEDFLLHIHMTRGDDLHAIKYMPIKLKGPTRHWLHNLPSNSIGSWEELKEAFRENFQGTYVRPPDADDLNHIIQKEGESAHKFWSRFLTKKNEIADHPDAKAIVAFKHSIRGEWLVRQLRQDKPRTMAALTSLMTRFCTGGDSWLAHSSHRNDFGTSEACDGNESRCNKNTRRNKNNGSDVEDSTVNAGFSSS